MSSDIRVADGITEPGAMLWHVSGTGEMTVFTALREDTADPFPCDRLIVAMSRGLYEPLRCFIDKARAETVAERARELLGLRNRGGDEDGEPVG